MTTAREPWIKIRVGIVRSDKIAALSNDTARWGWLMVLCEAKTQRRPGVFISEAALRDRLPPRCARYLPAWLKSGLLHKAPDLCDDCREAYADDGLKPAEFVIHDYREEQRTPPPSTDRVRRWRQEQRERKRAAQPHAQHVANAMHSRARGMTVTVTGERGESRVSPRSNGRVTPLYPPTSTEPRLTKAQLEAWSDPDLGGPDWRPFRAAWLARGLLWPPAGASEDQSTQRGLLWQIANLRPNDLGRWVAEAPPGRPTDVIAHVLERWHAIRAAIPPDPSPTTRRGDDGPQRLGALLRRVAGDSPKEAPA